MQRYSVEEMACEHCAGTVTKAIEHSDPHARVTVDLPSKTVEVESALGDDDIREAIRSAGYEPRAM